MNKYLSKIYKILKEYVSKLLECLRPQLLPSPKLVFISKPSGLKNIKETCYMNSLIQALASNDKIIKQFENVKINLKISSLQLNMFIDLLHGVNDPESNIDENTNKLVLLINRINWNKTSQQDSYDLLSAIINSIQKEISSDLSIKNIQMPMKTKIVHKFEGVGISSRIQDHLGLSLGLCGEYRNYPGVTLKYLIDEHFSPILIDGDESKTTQMFFYQKAPEVLLLHIQANKWNAEQELMIKPDYHIKYEQRLSLNFDIACDLNGIIKDYCFNYELCAIVHHMGDISSGHYIVYRKWQGKWYLVNDEQVTLVEFNYDVCPYILIYGKEDSTRIAMI